MCLAKKGSLEHQMNSFFLFAKRLGNYCFLALNFNIRV